MKRELVEDKQQEEDRTNMFHQTHTNKFQHHHSSAANYYQEADSQTPSPDRRRNAAKEDALPFPQRAPSNDGATIEVVRRPRGRPPGSKNKPKPPVIITRDSAEPAMSPYVLELPADVDIVDCINRFCRKRNMGLCLLNGNGTVTNVTLKQPSTTPGATVTFHGRFDILSISATVLPPGGAAAAANGPFALSLAGPQGQVVGGHVVGPLISAGTIYLVAANFSNPSFHELPQADHNQEDSGRDGGLDSPKSGSGGGSGNLPPTSGGPSMYSYQQADVIWAPATRPPPPPPPY